MRLAVSTQGYASAAEALVSGNELAARGAVHLGERLRGYAGMAGDDATATDFAAAYDTAAAASVEALGSVVGAFGALGRMVEASLTNHARADARSTLPGWARPVAGPPTVSDRVVGVLLAPPPSSLGADSSRPGGPAGLVLDALQDVFWPNADTGRVRAAATSWSAAAESVDLLTAHCDSALAALDGERSPEIPLAVAVVRDVRDRVVDLSAQLAALGTACRDYADHVETKRAELLSLLEDLVTELGVTAVLGGIASVFSGGAASGIATGVGSARLASAAARARGILDSLRVLTGGTAFAVRPVAVTAGEVSAQTARINGARVLLTEAGEGGVGRTSARAVSLLARHEGPGRGHAIREHVGKSARYLHERVLKHPTARHASTFPDEASASRHVTTVLDRQASEIESWLATGKKQLRLDARLGDFTGISVNRAGEVIHVQGVRVVLVSDASMPEGYWIKTAFPQL